MAPLQITTGSRLHFGPLAAGSTTGRAFGGLGMMLEHPGYDLRVTSGSQDTCDGPEEFASIVLETLRRLRDAGSIPADGVAIELLQCIPRHQGLGSGTQLALATTQAAIGRTRLAPFDLAQLAGRGKRSAIGVFGFEQGGFLVDAGKRQRDELGELALRLEFPTDWPVLLWCPPDDQGLSGSAEKQAFARMPPMSEATTHHLCALILREMIPALKERDFNSFTSALQMYGQLVGESFCCVQGGIWSASRGAEIVAWFAEHGLRGMAQSSWGPTIAAFAPDVATAAAATEAWPYDPRELVVTRAINHGAALRPVEAALVPRVE